MDGKQSIREHYLRVEEELGMESSQSKSGIWVGGGAMDRKQPIRERHLSVEEELGIERNNQRAAFGV